MSANRTPQSNQAGKERPSRIQLFDPDGLPWTARLDLSWLIILSCITGGLIVVPLGLYLGLWLLRKGCTPLVLAIYTLAVSIWLILLLPDSLVTPRLVDVVSLFMIVLWVAGTFLARHQIQQLYTIREGSKFHLSLPLSAIFTTLYLNYRIRPEYPPQS